MAQDLVTSDTMHSATYRARYDNDDTAFIIHRGNEPEPMERVSLPDKPGGMRPLRNGFRDEKPKRKTNRTSVKTARKARHR